MKRKKEIQILVKELLYNFDGELQGRTLHPIETAKKVLKYTVQIKEYLGEYDSIK